MFALGTRGRKRAVEKKNVKEQQNSPLNEVKWAPLAC
jgi:hypothetical protein